MHAPRDKSSKDKVIFNLEKDAWHGFGSKTLWCESVKENVYRVSNSPFFVLNLSYGDEVIVEKEDENLIFKQVKSRSGHSTYRMIVLENNSIKVQTL